MYPAISANDPVLLTEIAKLYREFFDRAEKKRRWNVDEDIPWDQVNRSMNPAIADVVESFCVVELYLPDYIGKAIPMVRQNHGWAAFHSNWGYEESKHSMSLGDWLLKSGLRTEEQMTDLEHRVFEHEYQLPEDSPVAMVIYGMLQELATFIHYRNLRVQVDLIGDPALSKVLSFLSIDERAHHAFYRSAVKLFLKLDRAGTLEQIKRTVTSFAMPAVHMLQDGKQRIAAVKNLGIFNEDIFARDVYLPVLEALEIEHRELRTTKRKSL